MLARLLAAFVVLSVILNGLLLVALEQTDLARRPIDVQTRGLYDERLRQLESTAAGSRAVALGDSVVFGGHLAETHGSRWPAEALPAQLERQLGAVRVWNLGIDGLLYRELRCVLDDVLARRPAMLFVNLSPRPFAQDFATGEQEPTRAFVCAQGGVVGAAGRALRRAIPALRVRDLWQFGWLGTTPRAFLHQTASSFFAATETASAPRDDEAEDDDAFVAAQLWKLRAASRLSSIDVRSDHPQAASLDHLLASIRNASSTRIVVFYLHEDESALLEQLEPQRFHAQRERFSSWIARGLEGAAHARFVELPAAEFQGEYVDQVHLTATGYRRLSTRLIAALSEVEPPRDPPN